MTVYVINPNPREDISDANRFGDVRYINHRYVYADELKSGTNALPDEIVSSMRDLADRFDPERDYLMIFGDHLQLVQFVALLAIRHSKFRVLRYDREQRLYFSSEITAPIGRI